MNLVVIDLTLPWGSSFQEAEHNQKGNQLRRLVSMAIGEAGAGEEVGF